MIFTTVWQKATGVLQQTLIICPIWTCSKTHTFCTLIPRLCPSFLVAQKAEEKRPGNKVTFLVFFHSKHRHKATCYIALHFTMVWQREATWIYLTDRTDTDDSLMPRDIRPGKVHLYFASAPASHKMPLPQDNFQARDHHFNITWATSCYR